MKVSTKTKCKKNIVAKNDKQISFAIMKKSDLQKSSFLNYSCCKHTQRRSGRETIGSGGW